MTIKARTRRPRVLPQPPTDSYGVLPDLYALINEKDGSLGLMWGTITTAQGQKLPNLLCTPGTDMEEGLPDMRESAQIFANVLKSNVLIMKILPVREVLERFEPNDDPLPMGTAPVPGNNEAKRLLLVK